MKPATQMLADIRMAVLKATGEAPTKVTVGDVVACRLADELALDQSITGRGMFAMDIYESMCRGGATFMGMEIEVDTQLPPGSATY